MYDRFRNELMTRLLGTYSPEIVQDILYSVDTVSSRYEITAKTEELALLGENVPQIVKEYFACKIVAGQSMTGIKNQQYTVIEMLKMINKPINQITPNDIRMWLYTLKEQRGISDRTASSYRCIVSTFFKWCLTEEYITKDPTVNVSNIKYEKKEKAPLTQIELEYIRNACEDERDRAMVEFLYSTGCRVSEMCDCKISDVNFQTREVKLFGKGKKHRVSYLNAKALFALNKYLASRHDSSEYLFVSKRAASKLDRDSAGRIFKAIVKKAGLDGKGISPHSIRHTTATAALNAGMPLEEIKEMLGHESISTTMIYAKTNQAQIKADHQKYVV